MPDVLDPDLLIDDEPTARRELQRRGAGPLYDAFITVFRELNRAGVIDKASLVECARSVTLEALTAGTEAADLLWCLIDAYLRLPNLSHPDVPAGRDRLVHEWWPRRRTPASPRAYEELMLALGMLRDSASKAVAREGFPVLFGAGATLDRALVNYLLDSHTSRGYAELMVPTVVNQRAMFANGAFPQYAAQSFAITGTDLYLNPTIEVQQTNLLRNCLLPASALPLRWAGYARSFRIEDEPTTAYTRLHEFGKVEIFVATAPEAWRDEYDRALAAVEAVLLGLELPYRRILLCDASLGLSYNLATDFYVYAPGSDEWLEVATCATNSDFAARRIGARYRDDSGGERLLHTLHMTAVALPRLLVALLENYQTPRGTVQLPVALSRYLPGVSEIAGPG
jgi:seryl-tRNA synthetase